jgi:hypothetical protein
MRKFWAIRQISARELRFSYGARLRRNTKGSAALGHASTGASHRKLPESLRTFLSTKYILIVLVKNSALILVVCKDACLWLLRNNWHEQDRHLSLDQHAAPRILFERDKRCKVSAFAKLNGSDIEFRGHLHMPSVWTFCCFFYVQPGIFSCKHYILRVLSTITTRYEGGV